MLEWLLDLIFDKKGALYWRERLFCEIGLK